MKTLHWLSSMGVVLLLASQGNAQPADLPIARVGDVIITADEFQRDMEFRMKQIEVERGASVVPDQTFRIVALNELINAKVLTLLAENSKVEVPEEEVEREFELRKASMPSEEAYAEYLAREGLSEPELKALLRKRLQTERYIDEKTADIEISDEAVQAEYDRWLKDGKLDRDVMTADFAHILIRPTADGYEGWNRAQQAIHEARNRILAGESFEEVAKEVSQDTVSAHRGGTYFEATPELVSDDFSERLFAMSEGEVSEPFRGRSGWHILKIISHNEPGRVSFEKVKEELRENLMRAARQQRLADLVKGYRSVLDIELYKSDHFTGEESLDVEEVAVEGVKDGSDS